MFDHLTDEDLRQAYNEAPKPNDYGAELLRRVHAYGLDVRGWALDGGDRANGVSWSIRTGMGGADSIVGLPPFGHIGKTAGQAETFLGALAAGFESVAYARTRKEWEA